MKDLAVASAALLVLGGCAPPAAAPSPAPAVSSDAQSPTSQSTTPAPSPQPLDLAGKWKQTNSKADTAWQAITITKNTIDIQWVSDNGDTKSVYWVGTFPAPKTTADAYEWISKRDRKKTDGAALASTAKTKAFAYANGVLSYEVTMLGTTTTVKAERV